MRRFLLASILASFLGVCSQASAWDLSGKIAGEVGVHPDASSNENHQREDVSLVIQPRVTNNTQVTNGRLILEPFLRIDQQDQDRTHADLREFSWTKT